MRRDKNDIEWQTVKEEVRARDKVDRILKILTIKEALLLQRKAPRMLLKKLDCAHVFPVSIYPDCTYNLNNIVLLNRYSHSNLDNLLHPITGDPITYTERQLWWCNILGDRQWGKLMHSLGDVDESSS